MTALNDVLFARVAAHFKALTPAGLGVAVSGGGDSVALLLLLHRFCTEHGIALQVATVDHGLRADAQSEADSVTRVCQSLGRQHTILRWRDWDGCGNLQDQARRARYDLLTEWARSLEIPVLAMGHTADDQAETVLMRLGRASGVSGLSGMPASRTVNGVTVIRPLLNSTRAELRDFLKAEGVTWVEDPSNLDPRFDRVRARQVLDHLQPLGITAQILSDVAQNMLRAREALDWYTFLAARDLVSVQMGCIVLDPRKFRTLPEEIARRLLVHALRWIAGEEYPARRRPVADLLDKARRGQSGTLGGCRMFAHQGQIWISRELNAVRDHCAQVAGIWDNRWRLTGPGGGGGYEVRALGVDGLRHCATNGMAQWPRIALEASPAVWHGTDLVAAPLAGFGSDWQAELLGGAEEFFAMILSH